MQLSPHFSTEEFACRCGCGFGTHSGDVSVDLLRRLETMRADPDVGPMMLNSGCRCVKHNAEVGGAPTSAHTCGEAADIACPDSHRAFVLVRAAFAAGFRRIGNESGCIHVDVSTRPVSPQDVLFGWDRTQHLPA